MAVYESGDPLTSGGNPITPSWTDEPIVADVTFVKKQHIVELRAILTDLDGHYHVVSGVNTGSELPDVTVTYVDANENIAVDVTFIKAQHTQEIIDYLKDFDGHYHKVTLGAEPAVYDSTTYDPALTFEDDPVVTDVDWAKTPAHQQLRTYLNDYAEHHHFVDCACECTCTCECQCQCQCQCTCTETCEAECPIFD